MPSAAIATDVADFVLPLKQLADRLVELIGTKDHVASSQRAADEEDNLRRILAHLRVRTGHDFSHYKRSTVMRRLLRRMQVTRKENFEDYFSFLRDHVEEAQALLADLLISVTTFFRDPKAFESLGVNVIPHLFRGETQNPVRVWVAGCATGEEAYSIAMLLMEEASKHEVRPEIQVFGSDMDSRALNIAREGRYPVAIEADVTEDRLRRFFTRDGEHYRVKRELRDAVLFANHSLLKDPPFSRLDLVSCRNLLIYLDRDLQQQVLATLHYGLNPDGYLFLGSSESGEHPEGLFRVVDREARIYQSAGRAVERLPALPRILGIPSDLGLAAAPSPLSAREIQRALVFFLEGEEDKHGGLSAPAGELSSETVTQLRKELESAQLRLRTMREESEAANEELRAANEELQSINEEYRSTAEELETSKEELQSINEELQTVNSELKLKLETVSRANSDLQNLMAAMDFGTLFLDPGLKIKRFTPRLADLFSITPGDVGRPITDFTHQLDYDGLVADAHTVLDDLAPIEREIRSRKGGWYLVRIRPYRTVDDKIDGVVATFIDVTERRQMEDALRQSQERLAQEMRLVELSRAPIFVWELDGGIMQWNRGAAEIYGFSREDALGKNRDTLLKTKVPGGSLDAIKQALLRDASWNGELHQTAKDGRALKVESHLELIQSGGRRSVLESIREIGPAK
jgi:PAS domain S-box-containing protein